MFFFTKLFPNINKNIMLKLIEFEIETRGNRYCKMVY